MAVTYSRPCILETEQETTHLCSTWGYPELRCEAEKNMFFNLLVFFSPGIVLANQTLQLASVKAEKGFSKVAWFVFVKQIVCARCW